MFLVFYGIKKYDAKFYTHISVSKNTKVLPVILSNILISFKMMQMHHFI